jgi:hypothetical protein
MVAELNGIMLHRGVLGTVNAGKKSAKNGTSDGRGVHGVSNTYCRAIEPVYRAKERAV